jgi:hypothetical protein
VDPSTAGLPGLKLSAFLGDTGIESGQGIATVGSRLYAIVGSTDSPAFPTHTLVQPIIGGGTDAYYHRVDLLIWGFPVALLTVHLALTVRMFLRHFSGRAGLKGKLFFLVSPDLAGSAKNRPMKKETTS